MNLQTVINSELKSGTMNLKLAWVPGDQGGSCWSCDSLRPGLKHHHFRCCLSVRTVRVQLVYLRRGKTMPPHPKEFMSPFAAAAESLQSCPTLCDPRDGSPPGSPVPGILQARTLEWVAISFSNAWKGKVKVKSLSLVRLFVTPWTAAHQAPASMEFSRQEYWSGVPFCLSLIHHNHHVVKVKVWNLPGLFVFSFCYFYFQSFAILFWVLVILTMKREKIFVGLFRRNK